MSWLTADPARIVQAINFFQAILEVAIQLGLSITSYFRTPSHNAIVGGTPSSQHLGGIAADLVPDATTDRTAAIAALQAKGLTVIDEGTHLHVQAYPHHSNPLAA